MGARHRSGILFSLLLLIALVAPVNAGGWATVELIDPVEDVVVNDVVVLNIIVKQHGENPAHYDRVVITATHAASAEAQVIEASKTELTGRYTAEVVFDQPGRWKLRGELPDFGIVTAFPSVYVHVSEVQSSPTPVSADDDVVDINIIGGVFQPGHIEVEAGSTVRFTNNDVIKHEVAFLDMGIDDSGILEPGESFAVTFDSPGRYLFVCGPHLGMSGTIDVTA